VLFANKMNISKVISDNYFDVYSIDYYDLAVYPNFMVFGQGKANYYGKLIFPSGSGFLFYKTDAFRLLKFLMDIFLVIEENSQNVPLQATITNIVVTFDNQKSELVFQNLITLIGDQIVDFAKGFKSLVFKLFGYPSYVNLCVSEFLKCNFFDNFYPQNLKEKIFLLKSNPFLTSEENTVFYICEILERHKDLLKELNALKF
jgi:hypothetical protein